MGLFKKFQEIKTAIKETGGIEGMKSRFNEEMEKQGYMEPKKDPFKQFEKERAQFGNPATDYAATMSKIASHGSQKTGMLAFMQANGTVPNQSGTPHQALAPDSDRLQQMELTSKENWKKLEEDWLPYYPPQIYTMGFGLKVRPQSVKIRENLILKDFRYLQTGQSAELMQNYKELIVFTTVKESTVCFLTWKADTFLNIRDSLNNWLFEQVKPRLNKVSKEELKTMNLKLSFNDNGFSGIVIVPAKTDTVSVNEAEKSVYLSFDKLCDLLAMMKVHNDHFSSNGMAAFVFSENSIHYGYRMPKDMGNHFDFEVQNFFTEVRDELLNVDKMQIKESLYSTKQQDT